MTDVTRYEMCSGSGFCECDEVPSQDGDIVKFDDHARIVAAKDAEIAALTQRAEAEEKAHDLIASLCFAAGGESADGTSVAAVRSVIDMLDAARKDAETLRQGLRAFERTLDIFDEITLSDYLGGVGVDDITQRIVMAHGDDVMHDVGSMEELLAARVESWRYSDALLAELRAARAAEGGTPDA